MDSKNSKSIDKSLVLSRTANDEWVYNRNGSPQTEALEKQLAAYYSGSRNGVAVDSDKSPSKSDKDPGCLVVPSGMSAIHVAVSQSLASIIGKKKRVNLVYSSELFAATPALLKHLAVHHNANLIKLDICLPNAAIVALFETKALRNNANIFFVESSSNPNGFMPDWSLLPKLRELSSPLLVIVDNTWLSAASFNPFKVGADVVVSSLTKYYSAGSAIAGAVLTREPKFMQDMRRFAKTTGLHVSPSHAEIISQNLSSLVERVAKSSETTVKVVQKLLEQKVRVTHSSLPTHQSHALTKMYAKSASSVFTLMIPGKVDDLRKVFATSKDLEYKTSFGSAESRLDTFPKQVKGDVRCRIAVGYKDSADAVIAAVADLLARARKE